MMSNRNQEMTPERWAKLKLGAVLATTNGKEYVVLSVRIRSGDPAVVRLLGADGKTFGTAIYDQYRETGRRDLDAVRRWEASLGSPSPQAPAPVAAPAPVLRPWPRVRGMFARLFGGRR